MEDMYVCCSPTDFSIEFVSMFAGAKNIEKLEMIANSEVNKKYYDIQEEMISSANVTPFKLAAGLLHQNTYRVTPEELKMMNTLLFIALSRHHTSNLNGMVAHDDVVTSFVDKINYTFTTHLGPHPLASNYIGTFEEEPQFIDHNKLPLGFSEVIMKDRSAMRLYPTRMPNGGDAFLVVHGKYLGGVAPISVFGPCCQPSVSFIYACSLAKANGSITAINELFKTLSEIEIDEAKEKALLLS